MSEPTKRCPFCGEEILAIAIKCKHCSSALGETTRTTAQSSQLSVPPEMGGNDSDTKAKPKSTDWIFPTSWGTGAKTVGMIFILWVLYSAVSAWKDVYQNPERQLNPGRSKQAMPSAAFLGPKTPACADDAVKDTAVKLTIEQVTKGLSANQNSALVGEINGKIDLISTQGIDNTTETRHCSGRIEIQFSNDLQTLVDGIADYALLNPTQNHTDKRAVIDSWNRKSHSIQINATYDIAKAEERSDAQYVITMSSPEFPTVQRALSLISGVYFNLKLAAASDSGSSTKEASPPAAAPPAPTAAPSPIASQPEPQNQSAQPPAPAANATLAAAYTCDNVKACVDAMLSAARMEALSSPMEAARRIDAMPKPERGNRKLARKLNSEGLEALKQRKLADAAATLTKALETDRADEEITANLIYTYSEDGNYAKVEQLAYEGLLLNPRRSNIWLPIAIAKQKLSKPQEALQAMWLSWQFSADKQKLLTLLDKRIAEEADDSLRTMYMNAKAWAVDGKKPRF